jgi:excinuclease UvrABC nuclease subunit
MEALNINNLLNREDEANKIKEILKGKLGDIKKVYLEEMKALAANMQFEKANLLKEKLQFLHLCIFNSLKKAICGYWIFL